MKIKSYLYKILYRGKFLPKEIAKILDDFEARISALEEKVLIDVTVKVVDVNSNAISGATVEVNGSETYATDGDGKIIIRDVRKDTDLVLSVRCTGYAEAIWSGYVQSNEIIITMTDSPQLTIPFLIMDNNDYPVEDALVVLNGSEYRTYDDGYTDPVPVIIGSNSITVSCEGYRNFFNNNYVIEATDTLKTIKLEKIVLTIRAINRDDDPIPNAHVTFNNMSMTTDQDGTCTYTGNFASGIITVNHDDYTPQSQQFTFNEDNTHAYVIVEGDFVRVTLNQPDSQPYTDSYGIVCQYSDGHSDDLDMYFNEPVVEFRPASDNFKMSIIPDNIDPTDGYDGKSISVNKTASPSSRIFVVDLEDSSEKQVKFVFKDRNNNPISNETVDLQGQVNGIIKSGQTNNDGEYEVLVNDDYFKVTIQNKNYYAVTNGNNLVHEIIVD